MACGAAFRGTVNVRPWPHATTQYLLAPSCRDPSYLLAPSCYGAPGPWFFVAYKLPREADAQQFEVMCLGNGPLGDQRMRHYMLQIQDDAGLAVGSRQ